MGQLHQKVLGGPGFEERKDLLRRSMKLWSDLVNGREYDKDLMHEFYSSLALDISRQKKRFVVQQKKHFLHSKTLNELQNRW